MAIFVWRDSQQQQFEMPVFPGGSNLEFQSLKINTALGWIAIGNFYNPGNNIAHDEINFYLSQLDDSFVAVGDSNAHSPAVVSNAVVKALPLCLLNDGSFPTYIDNQHGTTSSLDLAILTSYLSICAILTQGPDLGSDHFPICRKIGIKILKSPEKTPV
jgi:hypothetical protein